MENSDLEIAKRRLMQNRLTLSIVKNGEVIFETSSYGISGFLEAIERLGEKLNGSSVADRVIGKAIALLCVHSRVKAVYAVVLSQKAMEFLQKYAVQHEWERLVEEILAPDKTEVCPFERLADALENPAEAHAKFKALQNSLKGQQMKVT